MNLKRWWCAATTHKWLRTRKQGVDLLTCRRCGYTTDVTQESRNARQWDSSGFGV